MTKQKYHQRILQVNDSHIDPSARVPTYHRATAVFTSEASCELLHARVTFWGPLPYGLG